jgi:hypothetical protein
MKFVQLKKFAGTSLAVLMAITLTACGGAGSGKNPLIQGITGPDVEVVNGRLVLSMVFQNIHIDGGATIPIPKYPNSSIQVGPDFQSSGTLLVLTVSVTDFLGDKGTLFNAQTLPGGRPIPGIAAGVMPAVAIQVPQLMNMVFYVGPEVLGVFVPFGKLNMQGAIVSFRFYNKASEPVGMLSLVGSDAAGLNAGILALIRADLAGILKKPSASTLAKLASTVQ